MLGDLTANILHCLYFVSAFNSSENIYICTHLVQATLKTNFYPTLSFLAHDHNGLALFCYMMGSGRKKQIELESSQVMLQK